jgi:hypothetical protein
MFFSCVVLLKSSPLTIVTVAGELIKRDFLLYSMYYISPQNDPNITHTSNHTYLGFVALYAV